MNMIRLPISYIATTELPFIIQSWTIAIWTNDISRRHFVLSETINIWVSVTSHITITLATFEGNHIQ